MRRALLVTGSRALVGSTCESVVRAVLSREIEELGPGMVIAGDASGPDAWARHSASRFDGTLIRHYCLNGTVVNARGDVLRRWIDAPTLEAAPPARVPLLRNAAMVAELAARACNHPDEWEVSYLALVAAWSQTHGTEHTARLAREAGIRGTTVRFEVDR